MYASDVKAEQAYDPRGSIGTLGEARKGEVPHQIDSLARTLKGIDQGLNTLSDRLGCTVMRPQSPTPAAMVKESPQAVMQTSMGSQLQDLTSHASLLNEHVQSIIARLEV